MLLIMQGLPPIQLGPWGTLILVVATVIFAYMAFRQKGWKEAAAAAAVTIQNRDDLLKNRNDTIAELRKSELALTDKCAKLEASRDLSPLENTVTAWINESRDRFTKAMIELSDGRKESNAVISDLADEMRAQRTIVEESFKALTKAFTDHVEDARINFSMRDEQNDARDRQTERIAKILLFVENQIGTQKQELGEVTARLDKR
jgi:hypothetical protein